LQIIIRDHVRCRTELYCSRVSEGISMTTGSIYSGHQDMDTLFDLRNSKFYSVELISTETLEEKVQALCIYCDNYLNYTVYIITKIFSSYLTIQHLYEGSLPYLDTANPRFMTWLTNHSSSEVTWLLLNICLSRSVYSRKITALIPGET
jgi:hypothetical protein